MRPAGKLPLTVLVTCASWLMVALVAHGAWSGLRHAHLRHFMHTSTFTGISYPEPPKHRRSFARPVPKQFDAADQ